MACGTECKQLTMMQPFIRMMHRCSLNEMFETGSFDGNRTHSLRYSVHDALKIPSMKSTALLRITNHKWHLPFAKWNDVIASKIQTYSQCIRILVLNMHVALL